MPNKNTNPRLTPEQMRSIITALHERAVEMAPKLLAVGVPACAVSPYDLPVKLEFDEPNPRFDSLTFALVTYDGDVRTVHKSGGMRPTTAMLGYVRFWSMVEDASMWEPYIGETADWLRDTNRDEERVKAYDNAVEMLADIGRAVVLGGEVWTGNNSTASQQPAWAPSDAIDTPAVRKLIGTLCSRYREHVEVTGMHGLMLRSRTASGALLPWPREDEQCTGN